MSERFTASGYGTRWYVVARNNRSIAGCYTRAMATRIARVLNAHADAVHPTQPDPEETNKR